jgi:ribose transport system ATP-binding protein
MFAKMLSSKSSIVILNHPTRGVDIGAKEEIYQLIRQMIDEGKSIIMLGDTLDECIGMCNRILVMKDGLVTGEFEAPPENKPDKMDIVQCIM